ncbi:small nuclear ribonucleoprotein Sm D3-like [Argiope bruennichi]|uniref:small nuclear ribonucleoprotein Sm D3-like n=1 Tax=Argiope bruennichi TaxID=94029 RepID=UPI002494C6C8|nr:small nuclear ribonucleoprotein Sm D3-like [Argiope bruennichi]
MCREVKVRQLHEAEGHIITLESITGDTYRGKLLKAEVNMNCLMSEVTLTYKNGKVCSFESMYIKGTKIRYFIYLDMIADRPKFRKTIPRAGVRGSHRGNVVSPAQGKF